MSHKTGEVVLNDHDRRLLGHWTADCAERSLALFEVEAPSDPRPREAIEAARTFARGGQRNAQLRSAASAAYAAAREVSDPGAAAAARAAGLAAATAFIHAAVSKDQEKHALGPAVYTARARELAASGEQGIGDQEIQWATGHAPPAVRDIIRRLPTRLPGRSRLESLYHQLDVGLRL